MYKLISKILPFLPCKIKNQGKHILIDMLSVGNRFLNKGRGIDYGMLERILKTKGYSGGLIKKALELYYPENFKYFYNKKSWLSSDGYIRLLQYDSLKKSKENLRYAKIAIYIAVITMIINVCFTIFHKPNSKHHHNTIFKQDCIIQLLQQNVTRQDSIIQSIYTFQKSMINNLSQVNDTLKNGNEQKRVGKN